MKVKEIEKYWREHYGCALPNSEIDKLFSRIRTLEEGINDALSYTLPYLAEKTLREHLEE